MSNRNKTIISLLTILSIGGWLIGKLFFRFPHTWIGVLVLSAITIVYLLLMFYLHDYSARFFGGITMILIRRSAQRFMHWYAHTFPKDS